MVFKDRTLLSTGLLFRFSLKNTILTSIINLQNLHFFRNIASVLYVFRCIDSDTALIWRVKMIDFIATAISKPVLNRSLE